MQLPPTRKAEAVKAAGEAAQTTLKSIVKEAVEEALEEHDYEEPSDSGSGAGRSLLLLVAGIGVGYLLAKRSPSWLSSAEESLGEKSGSGLGSIAETVVGGGESESESESGYDAAEETRAGSGTDGGMDVGSDGDRPDIESATDEGTASVGSGTDEAAHVDSDADEYGTEDTNVGPGGEEYGSSGSDEDAFGSDEDEGVSE